MSPSPPPIAGPVDPNAAILKQIVVESGGQVFRINANVPCRIDATRSVRAVIAVPSRHMTIFIPCDGPGIIDQIEDEQWPAAKSVPVVTPKEKKR